MKRRPVIAIIGASNPTEEEAERARTLGRLLAESGYILATGGLGGVMEEASRGAHEAGGMVLGVLPGQNADGCNRYVDLAIATGLGDARNAVITNTADCLVAIGGGLGTLSEIAFALRRNKPTIALGTWELDKKRLGMSSLFETNSADEALDLVRQALPDPESPWRGD